MKTLVNILVIFVIGVGSVIAQLRDSATTIYITNQNKSLFIDQDGDGTVDSHQHQKKEKIQRDQFIDKNGDGICDLGEQGLGFQRIRRRNPEQIGKHTWREKK